MAVCEACIALNNQLKGVDAHSALVEVGSTSLARGSMGMASGYATHYRCKTCGTEMTRDGDRKDPQAGWFITKAS